MSASQPNLFSNYPMTASYGQLPMQSPQGVTHENHQLMIQQYETVLQSLNHEFKKALEQNKNLQEAAAHHNQMQLKDKRLIADLQSTLEQCPRAPSHTQGRPGRACVVFSRACRTVWLLVVRLKQRSCYVLHI